MREIRIPRNRDERPAARWLGLAVGPVLFLISAVVATAATVPAPAAGNDWRDIAGFVPNNNGVPYFDHSSWDGSPPGNIWNVLNNLEGIPDSRLEFWGTAAGGPDGNLTFGLGGQSVEVKLSFEFAGNKNVNEFGWFAPDLGGNGFQLSDLHPLFAGSATNGATVHAQLPDVFGLYLRNTRNGDVFLSLAGLSPTDPFAQHFSVLRDTSVPTTLWLGVEDLPLGTSDKDFNDFVVSLTPAPEPGTLLLVGSGLVAGAGYVRRRRLSAN